MTASAPLTEYTWDAEGRPVTIDAVGLTYDALGRMVEQNRSGAYTQFAYGPHGGKLAIMNGQTLQKAIIPLTGGAQAVYNASGLLYYGHSDHLGSIRLGSTSSRTVSFDLAYAPFGETYATSGSTDAAFTGQRQDTVSGLYDFPAREYSTEGRWPSPDPSGLAAFHLTDPQSINRYVYARNTPLSFLDPTGLDLVDDYCDLFCDPFAGGDGGAIDDGGAPVNGNGIVDGLGSAGDLPLTTIQTIFSCNDPDCNSSQISQSNEQDFFRINGPGVGGLSYNAPSFADQQLQQIAPQVNQGAGALNDSYTYLAWFGGSIGFGALPSAGALWELGSAVYTDLAANLGTWQQFDPAGYGDAVDLINNWLPTPPSITSTGAGALMGYGLGKIWNPVDGFGDVWNPTKP